MLEREQGMELNMKDKVVVITGGSEGIGRAFVMQYLKEGCKVAVCARRQEVLDALKQECAGMGYGENVLVFPADVTETSRMREFRDLVVKTFGRLDVWVNNAGKSLLKPLMGVSIEDWNGCIALNLTSVFLCTRLAAEAMRETGGGVIINAGSYAGVLPAAGNGAYAAAKRGVSALTQLFAAELAPWNIRVVSFAPGMIATPLTAMTIKKNGENLEKQTALKRLGKPEDIAPAVVFLSSENASYITGVDLVISGGKFCVQNPMYAWDANAAL